MLKTSNVWASGNPGTPLMHYPDNDDWLATNSLSWGVGAWTMYAEQIFIRPILASEATVSFNFLSSLYALDFTNQPKAEFTDDRDMFRLNGRLLKLGIIWQWKAYKGFPYAEDMASYETALAMQIGADKGSNILTGGQRRFPGNVRNAYAGPLG
jgi:hypothetical protein